MREPEARSVGTATAASAMAVPPTKRAAIHVKTRWMALPVSSGLSLPMAPSMKRSTAPIPAAARVRLRKKACREASRR